MDRKKREGRLLESLKLERGWGQWCICHPVCSLTRMRPQTSDSRINPDLKEQIWRNWTFCGSSCGPEIFEDPHKIRRNTLFPWFFQSGFLGFWYIIKTLVITFSSEKVLNLCKMWTPHPPFLSNIHVLRSSEPEKMVFANVSVCVC